MSTDRSAIESATADAAGQNGHLGLGMFPDAVQLSLLRGENGRVEQGSVAQVRGRGRKPGSRNKRNQKVAQMIVQRYGDPLDALGNMMAMPLADAVTVVREAEQDPERLEELARIETMITTLGQAMSEKAADMLARRLAKVMAPPRASAMDVLALQVKVTQDLMTYVHGRQPISVDVTERTDAVIIIPGVNAPLGTNLKDLQKHIDRQGLAGMDFEGMSLIEDADFVDADEEADDDSA